MRNRPVAPNTGSATSTPFLDAANATAVDPSSAIRLTTPDLGNDGLPFVGHMLHFVHDAKRLIDRLHVRYGANFRINLLGNPVLVIGAPDAVRTVLMDNESNFSNRLGWIHAVGELFAGGLMLRDFEAHRRHRKMINGAFRSDALAGYADIMNPIIARSLDRWEEQTRSGSQIRFHDAAKQLTLEMGSEVFAGLRLGPEADRINQAFVDTVRATIAIVKKEVPGLSFKRGMDGRRSLERFFLQRIDSGRNGDGRDMFSELCRTRDESGQHLDDKDIVDHMIFLLMAAHDTTTSALSSIVWALATHPQWQDRLRQDAASLEADHLDFQNRDRLKQMQWVFLEALRLFPPVPFVGRRAIRECRVGDIVVPANTAISVTPLIAHFHPEFWTDPTHFKPERFSPDRAEDKHHSHCFFPFGGGAHSCIGMHFAHFQVKAFLYQFLQRFTVTLKPDYRLRMSVVPICAPKDGLPVTLTPLSR